jgi:hypothetical protein
MRILKIDEEFRTLLPPSNKKEQLEADILNDGYDKDRPIIVWKGKDIIVDGHTRYEICLKHKIEFTVLEKEFSSRDKVIKWILREQFHRRELTELQRAYIIGIRYKKEKKPVGTNRYSDAESKVVSNLPAKKGKSTAEIVGELFRVTSTTVKTAEKIANDIIALAENSGFSPDELLSIFSGYVKTAIKDIRDIKDLAPEEKKIVISEIRDGKVRTAKDAIAKFSKKNGTKQKKSKPPKVDPEEVHEEPTEAEPVDKEKIVESVVGTQVEPTVDTVVEEVVEPVIVERFEPTNIEENSEIEPTTKEKKAQPPQKNEHGVDCAYPEPVSMRIVRVKENVYAQDNALHYSLYIDKKVHDCSINPFKNEENTYTFKLPNIKNLIVDYRDIFRSSMPSVIDFPAEEKDLNFTLLYPDKEWNEFVKLRFPQLVRQKTDDEAEKDMVSTPEANEKAQLDSEVSTAQPEVPDDVVSTSEIEVTTETPKKVKAPKKEKKVANSVVQPEKELNVTEETKTDMLTRRESTGSCPISPQLLLRLHQLQTELGGKTQAEVVAWLLSNRIIDLNLSYEKPKIAKGEKRKNLRVNKDSLEQLKNMKKEHNIESYDEILMRLMSSKIPSQSSVTQTSKTEREV